MMPNLPKKNHLLVKIFCGLITILVLSFIFPEVVQAVCPFPQCTGQAGNCIDGAVRSCDLLEPSGYYRCAGSTWVYAPDAGGVSGSCAVSTTGFWANLGQAVADILKGAYKTGAQTLETTVIGTYIARPLAQPTPISQYNPSPDSRVLPATSTPQDQPPGIPGIMDNIALWGIFSIAGVPSSPQGPASDTGAISTIASLTAQMYSHPPASTSEYVAYLRDNLGIVRPAYAQGVGFSGLTPIINIWQAFRNISYLFFIIIFVLVGFAIMFRMRLNPQTVITIQNALPRLVLTIILVTFSYAIAGFLIDLIYVFLSLFFAVLGSKGFEIHQNIFKIFDDVFHSLWLGGTAPGQNLVTEISAIVSSLFGEPIRTVLSWSIGLLFELILSIAILFSLVKLFFLMLVSYISILLGTIIAPLMIMIEAIPGQKGFSNWLRMMLSNVIVFPAAIILFSLAKFMSDVIMASPSAIWVPPGVGAGSGSSYVAFFAIVGILLATPSIVDTAKKAIGGAGMGGMMAGAGAAIQTGWGVTRKGLGVLAAPVTYPLGLYKAGVEKGWTDIIARGAGERGLPPFGRRAQQEEPPRRA